MGRIVMRKLQILVQEYLIQFRMNVGIILSVGAEELLDNEAGDRMHDIYMNARDVNTEIGATIGELKQLSRIGAKRERK